MQHNSNRDTQIAESGASPSGVEDKKHIIVGIGASAGGLEAINELFDNIPEGNGFSFVVVQHLSPNHKSLMDELLAKHTKMQIRKAEDGMLILPNHIYLIPNKHNMTVQHGRLQLTDKLSDRSPNYAINIFLESLAKAKRQHAIGVILSGTGSDGTQGIKAIKENGGLVIVQDPVTAKFDGMPNSAISSGYADFILPPELMAEEIFKFSGNALYYNGTAYETAVNKNSLKDILALVKEHTNFDFSAYKEQTLERRIQKRSLFLNIDNFREYLLYLRNNPDEIGFISKEFLIGVTKFFRDEEAFEHLREKVMPELLKKKAPDQTVKLWVTACSTGEEAYSLAMLACECMEALNLNVNVKIFATDVDSRAIEYAAKGMYPEAIEKDLSPERLERFFVREGKHYSVCQQIRRMVIFAEHNITKDPPFSKMDLVSCRNMLIYMKPELQRKVLNTFHFSLKVGGYLFLGPSERCDQLKAFLKVVNKKWNIFKVVTKSKNFVFEGSVFEKDKRTNQTILPDVSPKRKSLTSEVNDAFQELIVEEMGYAAVFINEELEIMQAIGDYKRFILIPDRVLQLNILKLVPKEFSVALNLAFRKAIRNNEKVVSKRVEMLKGDTIIFVTVIVKPYLEADHYSRKFLAVLFKEEGSKQLDEEDEDYYSAQLSMNRLLELESELKQTKEDLQSVVEELETSNEEMQSSNEELISSNEELQSTNEELQSVNEELHTVNAEHQLKIRELEELNDDLNNYFRSSEIGQIFLDSQLVIRKFTPAIKQQINLIESDIGRPIEHLSYNLKKDGFIEDIRFVLKSSAPIQKEIESRDGRYYLMKIMPYLRQDNTTDGVVVTFVDISKVKGLNNLLKGVLESSLNGIMAFSFVKNEDDQVTDLEWTLINDAAENILGKKAAHLPGKRLLQELPAFKKDGLFKKFLKVAETGITLHQEYKYQHKKGDCWLEVLAVPIDSGIAVTLIDINDKKSAEEEILQAYEEVKEAEDKLRKLNTSLEQRVEERTKELLESEERLRLVSRATNDAVWDWNLVTNDLWWNEGFQKLFGYKEEEIEPGVSSWFNRLHVQEKEKLVKSVHESINKGAKQWSAEHRFLKADGSYAYVYNRGYILENEYGVPFRMLGSMVDLTGLRQAQDELEESNVTLRRINTDLDNFIYTASHDLKAPVTNLEGLVNLMGPRLKDKLDPKEQQLLEMIRRSVEKLNKTIIGLLEITRVQKDLERKIDLLSFKDVFEDVTADVEHLVHECDAYIETSFEVEHIHYAHYNLRSIMYNLLSNALKYCSRERKPFVSISTKKAGEYVLLRFEDNGLGMNQQQLGKLFSMFKRFHAQVEGTGIGLYMVKRIIENNEGKIEVESKENRGTTFKIYLKDLKQVV